MCPAPPPDGGRGFYKNVVINFIEKIQKFHDINMSTLLPYNFLTLTVNLKTLDTEDIRAKYPQELANKLISLNENLKPYIAENNNRFAIGIDHFYYLTKNPEKATAKVMIDKNADAKTKIVTRLKDPNLTHKYTAKACCFAINKRLADFNINFKFNRYHFNLFCKYYRIKENEKLCFTYNTFSQPHYTYSQQTIDLIVDEICKDPENIVNNLKLKVKS